MASYFADNITLVPARLPTVSEEEKNEFIRKFYSISPEEHKRIKDLDQHDADGSTNDDWIEARRLRFTGSASGSFGLQNPYEYCAAYVDKKIHPQEMDARGKQYCKWGNDHEDDAEAAFEKKYIREQLYRKTRSHDEFLGYKISHLGLYVCKKPGYAMLGMSPDGILHSKWRSKETGKEYIVHELLEYKCPATWEKKKGNPFIYPEELVPRAILPVKSRKELGITHPPTEHGRSRIPVPAYYLSQVTYGMALFNASGVKLERAWFVVWEPDRVAVTCVPRDRVYGDWLLERGKHVWTEDFVPGYMKNQIRKERAKERSQMRNPQTDDRDNECADCCTDISARFNGINLVSSKINRPRPRQHTAAPAFNGIVLTRS